MFAGGNECPHQVNAALHKGRSCCTTCSVCRRCSVCTRVLAWNCIVCTRKYSVSRGRSVCSRKYGFAPKVFASLHEECTRKQRFTTNCSTGTGSVCTRKYSVARGSAVSVQKCHVCASSAEIAQVYEELQRLQEELQCTRPKHYMSCKCGVPELHVYEELWCLHADCTRNCSVWTRNCSVCTRKCSVCARAPHFLTQTVQTLHFLAQALQNCVSSCKHCFRHCNFRTHFFVQNMHFNCS